MDTGRDDIAREILAYVAEHPEARDSVEGIAEWWLEERTAPCPLPEVASTLEGLVAEGLLIEDRRAGSSVYHAERRRRADIRRRLAQLTGPGEGRP